MNDNQIISDARGECRHNDGLTYCGVCRTGNGRSKLINLDYTTLSAWAPELYQWIEDEGLVVALVKHLTNEAICDELMGDRPAKRWWAIIKATPAQKAEALAKAIKESSQG